MTIDILEKRRRNNLQHVKFFENNRPMYLFAKDINYTLSLTNRAAKFDFSAMVRLYEMYNAGEYIPSNGYQAISWFKFIRHYTGYNESDVYCNIGLIYFLGDGVKKDLSKALWNFKQAAENGNLEAKYLLGELYLHAPEQPADVWFTRDDEIFHDMHAAFYWFNRCHYNCYAGQLGKLYVYGIGIENDSDNAFELFCESVRCQNYSHKMYSLAKKYLSDNDIDKGIYWLKRAADHLNDDAIIDLVKIYLEGTITAVDVDRAFWWLEKITDFSKVDTTLLYKIADKYLYGEDVDKNIDMAVYCYETLIELGDTNAACELTMIYYNGDGVPKDLVKAEKWAFQCGLGNSNEEFNMMVTFAEMYHYGKDVKINMQKAVYWYEEIVYWYAENPTLYIKSLDNYLFEDLVIRLAEIYRDGEGVPPNGERAVELLTNIADSDYVRYELGCMYLYGKGIDRDIDEAENYFFNISEWYNFNADVIDDLAECYLKGDGVLKNSVMAAYWYSFATDYYNNSYAMRINGDSYFNEKDFDTAIEWYEKAAEHGNIEAMRKLGDIYRYGQGVEIDMSKSVYWLDKALKKYLESAE